MFKRDNAVQKRSSFLQSTTNTKGCLCASVLSLLEELTDLTPFTFTPASQTRIVWNPFPKEEDEEFEEETFEEEEE